MSRGDVAGTFRPVRLCSSRRRERVLWHSRDVEDVSIRLANGFAGGFPMAFRRWRLRGTKRKKGAEKKTVNSAADSEPREER